MIIRIPTVVALALSVTSLVQAQQKQQQDPTGSWRWTNQQTGEVDLLRLQLKPRGQVVGAYHAGGSDKAAPIKEGRIDGDKFQCRLEIQVDGSDVEVDVDATLKGDQLTGVVHYEDAGGETGDLDWSAKRSIKVEDAVGEWQLEFTSPDGRDHNPVLFVKHGKDGVEVHITGQDDGKQAATAASFSDGKLVAEFKLEYDGQPLKLTYRGQPRGYEISGVIEFELAGDEGQFEFAGSRTPEK